MKIPVNLPDTIQKYTMILITFTSSYIVYKKLGFIVFIVLTSVAIVGVIFFCTLPRVHNADSDANDQELDYQSKTNGVVGAFVKAIRLFFTRDMLLLSITFLYTGTAYMLLIHIYNTYT